MRFLKRITTLSIEDWVHWVQACVVLIIIKLGLSIFTFKTFKKIYDKLIIRKHKIVISDSKLASIIWAVDSSSFHVPLKLVCLQRALALKYILRNVDGVQIHFGVANVNQEFTAHAWVTKEDIILIGGKEQPKYTPIWQWTK